jgi:hypothetical protein
MGKKSTEIHAIEASLSMGVADKSEARSTEIHTKKQAYQ